LSKRLAAGLPALCWASIIFWLSIDIDPPSPGAEGSTVSSLAPYVGHLAVYAVLAALLIVWRWATLAVATSLLPNAVVFVGVTAYGGVLELYQGTVPERTAAWGDVLLNGAGALAGIAGLFVLRALLTRMRLVH
jgi:VanZ family protein